MMRPNLSSCLLWSVLLVLLATSSKLPFVLGGEPLLTERTAFSYDQCLEWGFDPSNLSCDTCSLFLDGAEDQQQQTQQQPQEPFYSECRTCCQNWRKNPLVASTGDKKNKKKKKKNAILYRSATILTGSMYLNRLPEVKDFVEKDLPDLIDQKGEEALEYNEVHPMQPPTLFFFKGKKVKGAPPADEVIHLEKWKRDDIRDLVANLLPDEI